MVGEIVGVLLIIVGVLCTFVGCIVEIRNPAGGMVFWLGLAMIAFGWTLNYTTATKTCPWCRKRIRYHAGRCKHCGAASSK